MTDDVIELLKEAVNECSTVTIGDYEVTFNHPNQLVVSVAGATDISKVVSTHYLNMKMLDYGSLKTSIEREIGRFEEADDDFIVA